MSWTTMRVSKENLDKLNRLRFNNNESADTALTRILQNINEKQLVQSIATEVEERLQQNGVKLQLHWNNIFLRQ